MTSQKNVWIEGYSKTLEFAISSISWHHLQLENSLSCKKSKHFSLLCLTTLFYCSLLVSSLTGSAASLTFRRHPASQTVQVGSRVIFKCSVLLTNRKVTYEWQHNNQTIRTEKQSRFTIRSDGSLRIDNTDLDDSGNYQCIAMARAKRSGIIRRKARSRIAKLTVEGKLNTVVFVTNNKKFYGSFWLHRALLNAL